MENILTNEHKSYKGHIYNFHDTNMMLLRNALNISSPECSISEYEGTPIDLKNCIYTVTFYMILIKF